MDAFSRRLALESWALYVVGILVIICRMIARRIAKGTWKKLQVDDYIMMVIAITFTGVIVSVNETAVHGSNYLPPGVAEELSDEERESAVWGSKMTFVLEHFTLCSLWMVKTCLLIFYRRLTLGLRQQLAVKLVAIYVGTSFVVIEILFCAVWCGPPITMYWDVPVRQSQCATYYRHMILTTVLNISSDIMMICIPMPIMIRSQLRWKQKFLLCCLFSMGVFVILMAVLNRYYNFTMQYTPTFLKWYVAEVATAVYVGNLPLIWPLVLRIQTSLSRKSQSSAAVRHYLRPVIGDRAHSKEKALQDPETVLSETLSPQKSDRVVPPPSTLGGISIVQTIDIVQSSENVSTTKSET